MMTKSRTMEQDERWVRPLKRFIEFINVMKKKTKKMNEGWSDKYKKSIDCNNPKGFSQRAYCQGKKKTFKEFMGD